MRSRLRLLTAWVLLVLLAAAQPAVTVVLNAASLDAVTSPGSWVSI